MKSISGAMFNGGTIDKADLDLSEFGLYDKKDPNVSEEDYFLTDLTILGKQLWARRSEEGVKWFLDKPKEKALKKEPVKRKRKMK